MPTVTIGSFEGGQVRFEMDVDASDRITAVRCINDLGVDVGVQLTQGEGRTNAGRTTTMRRLGPGISEFTIATTPSQRISAFFDSARNRWDGIDFRMLVPWL